MPSARRPGPYPKYSHCHTRSPSLVSQEKTWGGCQLGLRSCGVSMHGPGEQDLQGGPQTPPPPKC